MAEVVAVEGQRGSATGVNVGGVGEIVASALVSSTSGYSPPLTRMEAMSPEILPIPVTTFVIGDK